jgi:hypothetical protein
LNYWKGLLVGLAGVGLAVASCSHPSGTGTTGTGGSNGTGGSGDCPVGSVGCPCIGTTCDQDLSCADLGNGKTQCVSTAATGGAPGSGGSVATGGAIGTGGAQATGGSPGSGGSGSGTGGASATGGSPGTGGTPADNLIVNGDFSQQMTNWNITENTPTNPGVNGNGQLCITLTSGTGEVIVGWGSSTTSASLSAGVNYTLSYQASASAGLSEFDVHIGQAVGSFTLDKDLGNDNVGTSLGTITHMFSLSSADPQAGVAFLIKASGGSSTVCIDNVILTAN